MIYLTESGMVYGVFYGNILKLGVEDPIYIICRFLKMVYSKVITAVHLLDSFLKTMSAHIHMQCI